MADGVMSEALAIAAHTEIAKAKSLRSRYETHGSRMGGDARELLWAMIFAHEDAARDLLDRAKAELRPHLE
jgi:hypothetical protein